MRKVMLMMMLIVLSVSCKKEEIEPINQPKSQGQLVQGTWNYDKSRTISYQGVDLSDSVVIDTPYYGHSYAVNTSTFTLHIQGVPVNGQSVGYTISGNTINLGGTVYNFKVLDATTMILRKDDGNGYSFSEKHYSK